MKSFNRPITNNKSLKGLVIWLSLVSWLAMPMPSTAQTEEAAELPPGVSIEVHAEPPTATVGDHIRIDFDVTLPEGYEAQFPYPGDRVGDFEILQFFPGPSLPDHESAEEKPAATAPPRHIARVITALYQTGEFDFPSISMTLRTPENEILTIDTPTVSILVESVLTEGEQGLLDLKSQAEIEAPFNWLLWTSLVALGLALAGLVWWLRRRKRRPTLAPAPLPRRDPLEVAESDLKELLKLGHLESGRIKQFYVSLSEIVKRILEAGYGIQTLEKTTVEILAELREKVEEMSADKQPEEIESFLLASDLVKFAKYIPSKYENDQAVQDAFKILEYCRLAVSGRHAPAAAPAGGTSS